MWDQQFLRLKLLSRCKVETQLLSWLQKYDLEMGEKQVELDEFIAKYEDECQKVEDLEVNFVVSENLGSLI